MDIPQKYKDAALGGALVPFVMSIAVQGFAALQDPGVYMAAGVNAAMVAGTVFVGCQVNKAIGNSYE